MNPYPHEPLTPEERELAQLTSRLPPHGEPSAALDARILAAAHAAAAPQPVRAEVGRVGHALEQVVPHRSELQLVSDDAPASELALIHQGARRRQDV